MKIVGLFRGSRKRSVPVPTLRIRKEGILNQAEHPANEKDSNYSVHLAERAALAALAALAAFRRLSPPFAAFRRLSPPFAAFRGLSPPFATFRHLSPPFATFRQPASKAFENVVPGPKGEPCQCKAGREVKHGETVPKRFSGQGRKGSGLEGRTFAVPPCLLHLVEGFARK